MSTVLPHAGADLKERAKMPPSSVGPFVARHGGRRVASGVGISFKLNLRNNTKKVVMNLAH